MGWGGGGVAASSISTWLVADPLTAVGFKVGPPLIKLAVVFLIKLEPGELRVELFPPYSHDSVAGPGAGSCMTLHTEWVGFF